MLQEEIVSWLVEEVYPLYQILSIIFGHKFMGWYLYFWDKMELFYFDVIYKKWMNKGPVPIGWHPSILHTYTYNNRIPNDLPFDYFRMMRTEFSSFDQLYDWGFFSTLKSYHFIKFLSPNMIYPLPYGVWYLSDEAINIYLKAYESVSSNTSFVLDRSTGYYLKYFYNDYNFFRFFIQSCFLGKYFPNFVWFIILFIFVSLYYFIVFKYINIHDDVNANYIELNNHTYNDNSSEYLCIRMMSNWINTNSEHISFFKERSIPHETLWLRMVDTLRIVHLVLLLYAIIFIIPVDTFLFLRKKYLEYELYSDVFLSTFFIFMCVYCLYKYVRKESYLLTRGKYLVMSSYLFLLYYFSGMAFMFLHKLFVFRDSYVLHLVIFYSVSLLFIYCLMGENKGQPNWDAVYDCKRFHRGNIDFPRDKRPVSDLVFFFRKNLFFFFSVLIGILVLLLRKFIRKICQLHAYFYNIIYYWKYQKKYDIESIEKQYYKEYYEKIKLSINVNNKQKNGRKKRVFKMT